MVTTLVLARRHSGRKVVSWDGGDDAAILLRALFRHSRLSRAGFSTNINDLGSHCTDATAHLHGSVPTPFLLGLFLCRQRITALTQNEQGLGSLWSNHRREAITCFEAGLHGRHGLHQAAVQSDQDAAVREP